ncbi:MAG: zinc ribbon domain-containing protein [Coriobacteriales bacterium]|jgi:hypothetical protein|nr:zinc ribbon domain-containing protein [Coriobacteriales bacterium]
MFCKECGRQLKDDAKFCPQCGTAVTLPTTAAPDAAQAASVPAAVTPDTSVTGAAAVSAAQPVPVSAATATVPPAPAAAVPGQPVYQTGVAQPAPTAYAATYQTPAQQIEAAKARFAQALPHLAGCVPASFAQRFGRNILQNLLALVPYYLLTLLNLIPFGGGASYYSYYYYSEPNGWLGTVLGLVWLAVYTFLQYSSYRSKGKGILIDDLLKLRWIDVHSGRQPSAAAIWKFEFLFDAGPALVMLVAALLSLVLALGHVYSMALVGLVLFYLIELALLATFIVAWVQIYQDKFTHRCFMDKIANIVVIDVAKGANPLGL